MQYVSFSVVGLLALLHVGCAIPLLNASAAGDTEKVLSLLQNGHEANEVFPIVGTTPLMLAAAYGHDETIRTLLDAGADVNAADFTGWTVLHAAAYNGDPNIVMLLLRHGAIKERGNLFLESPMKTAERLGHKNVVPLLE